MLCAVVVRFIAPAYVDVVGGGGGGGWWVLRLVFSRSNFCPLWRIKRKIERYDLLFVGFLSLFFVAFCCVQTTTITRETFFKWIRSLRLQMTINRNPPVKMWCIKKKNVQKSNDNNSIERRSNKTESERDVESTTTMMKTTKTTTSFYHYIFNYTRVSFDSIWFVW